MARSERRQRVLCGACAALVGLLGTVAFMVNAWRTPGVFYSQANVLFISNGQTSANTLRNDQSQYVAFAAIVERELNGNIVMPRLSSPSATLYASGVRHGYQVTLVDNGGQWQTNFNEPVLRVEVVGASAEQVQKTMTTLIDRINQLARSIQERLGVASPVLIVPNTTPQEPPVYYIAAHRTRAVAAIALLGAGLTLAAMTVLDRGIQRRYRLRSARQFARSPVVGAGASVSAAVSLHAGG